MKLMQNSSTASASSTRITTFLATDEKTAYYVLDAAMVIPIDLESFAGYVDGGEMTSADRHREDICRNPRRKAALERARRQIASALPRDTKFPLTRLRLRAGLSQADLAKLLDTHQPAIARLENGLSDPRFTTIKRLAVALGVSEAEILEAIDSGRVAGKLS